MTAVDTADRPFGLTPEHVIEMHLPYPPSTNKLWRRASNGRQHVTLSDEYRAWKRRADDLTLSLHGLRGVRQITGAFEVRLILQRLDNLPRGDLDNRIKAVLDWAQSRELILNDKHCERLSAEWGDAPHGCRLILRSLG